MSPMALLVCVVKVGYLETVSIAESRSMQGQGDILVLQVAGVKASWCVVRRAIVIGLS